MNISRIRQYRVYRYFSLLYLLLLTMVSASATADIDTLRLTNARMDFDGPWEYRLDGRGKLWLGYYDEGRILRLRHPDGEEVPQAPEGRRQAPSGIAMVAGTDSLSILWRDKFPDKGLYLANVMPAGNSVKEIGGETEPLARIKALQHQDQLQLLWFGEQRDSEQNQNYHLYYRQFNQTNGELSPIDRVMPGFYPVWASDQEGNLLVFSWFTEAGQAKVVARYRDHQEGKFGEAIKVADVAAITPIFDAFRLGERWFVMWLGQYGENLDEFRLEGAYSDDKGAQWQHFSVAALDNFDVANMNVATTNSGDILLALSGVDRGLKGRKHDIRFIRSSDRGSSWHVSRPRPEAVSATFNAKNPSLILGDTPGEVLMVWEDWRNIRSQIFASYSRDNGITWDYENIPLPQPEKINRGLRLDVGAGFKQEGEFNLIVEQAYDDSFAGKHLYRVKFPATDLAEFAKLGQEGGPMQSGAFATEPGKGTAGPEVTAIEEEVSPAEKRLQERVKGFWDAMMAEDYETTFSYYDPFYRGKNDLNSYRSVMGKIKFSDYKTEAITIDGRRAKVTAKVTAKIPPFKSMTGELIKQGERVVPLDITWVWVDGDWYREYYSEYKEVRYTRY